MCPPLVGPSALYGPSRSLLPEMLSVRKGNFEGSGRQSHKWKPKSRRVHFLTRRAGITCRLCPFFIPLSANQIKSVEFRWPHTPAPPRWTTTYSFALNFLITFRSPFATSPEPRVLSALLRMQQASKPINTIESTRSSATATFASSAGANCTNPIGSTFT